MATDRDFIAYVTEQVALGDRLTHKKMFGEYALYVDGKVVAFACDNSVFVKPSAAAATLAPGLSTLWPFIDRVAVRVHMFICDACPKFLAQVGLMRQAMDQWRNYRDRE